MRRRHHSQLRPDASEARLLEATVGPGRYRVLTRWPLTIALGPRAYAPALLCALAAMGIELGHGLGAAMVAGAIAGSSFGVALAAHEAGHLLCGRRLRGLVPRILLLRGSGGAAIVEGRFSDPRDAAVFAAGGPLASAALTLVYATAAVLAPWPAVRAGFLVPIVVNVILLAINLLPVAPSDGYALLRSRLWAATGSRREGERQAIAWSRAVLGFGLVVSLELSAASSLAAATALFTVVTLTIQHHAVARRVEQR